MGVGEGIGRDGRRSWCDDILAALDAFAAAQEYGALIFGTAVIDYRYCIRIFSI